MKKQCILVGVFFLGALFSTAFGMAQTKIATPVNPSKLNWAPDSGFWQLIIPAGHRKATVVQFYSPDSRLLHEDHLAIGMNPNSRKTRKLLYLELQKYLQDTAVTARR